MVVSSTRVFKYLGTVMYRHSHIQKHLTWLHQFSYYLLFHHSYEPRICHKSIYYYYLWTMFWLVNLRIPLVFNAAIPHSSGTFKLAFIIFSRPFCCQVVFLHFLFCKLNFDSHVVGVNHFSNHFSQFCILLHAIIIVKPVTFRMQLNIICRLRAWLNYVIYIQQK